MKNKYIFFNYLLRGLQIISYILTIVYKTDFII